MRRFLSNLLGGVCLGLFLTFIILECADQLSWSFKELRFHLIEYTVVFNLETLAVIANPPGVNAALVWCVHSYWIAIISGTGFLLWVIATARRQKLVPPNICKGCGYDLRATPIRCPECGHSFDH